MVDARTKLDIIYQEAMGDVHEILDRVDVLKAELPAAADALGDKLNVQTGHYLVAAEKLAAVLQGMAGEIDRAAAQAAVTAGEAVKLDVRQAATLAASEAIRVAVGNEVSAVVGELTKAGQLVRWTIGKHVAVVIGGAVLGGLVAATTLHYLPVGGGSAPQLSEADRVAIENGQKIQRVWNSLTDKERAHIQQLAGQK